MESGEFYKLYGKDSKVFPLVDDTDLISFCTFAEKDDVSDTDLTPWVGFVYTFPQFRGKRRIGKLIEHIYRLAKKDGFKNLYISTDQPLTEYEEKVIAVYHRINDCEDKWIVSLGDKEPTNEEILEKNQLPRTVFYGRIVSLKKGGNL